MKEKKPPLVGIIMGSDSDWPTMEAAYQVCHEFNIPCEVRVVSAHRTPEDMARYAKSVPFAVQPFVVRLDANSNAGGFVRNWPPPGERVSMHLGYAYQWFGFALTLLVIFIVLNVKKVEL